MGRTIVVLNYGPNGFSPDPEPVPLSRNDKLSFKLGVGPKNGGIKVTFQDGHCFSRTVFENEDPRGDITVVEDLTGPVKYKCELLVDGKVQPLPADVPGGTGVPRGGGGLSSN
jgi:hypothetical protein